MDYLIALGTHRSMPPAAIDHLVGAKAAKRAESYPHVRIFNHAWDDPQMLQTVGVLPTALTSRVFRKKRIMSERELVDVHVHLWNPQQFRLAWQDHEPALNKPLGLAEYPRQGAGSTITGIVYVEIDAAPHYTLLEAQWAASLAVHDARLQGIVAAAPASMATGCVPT